MAFSYSSAQLHRHNSSTCPGINISIIKELGLLRRPRYIHRGSCRKFIFYNQPSCSATNIPSVWSSAVRLTRHQSTVAPATINTGSIARSLHSSTRNTESLRETLRDPHIPGWIYFMEWTLGGAEWILVFCDLYRDLSHSHWSNLNCSTLNPSAINPHCLKNTSGVKDLTSCV